MWIIWKLLQIAWQTQNEIFSPDLILYKNIYDVISCSHWKGYFHMPYNVIDELFVRAITQQWLDLIYHCTNCNIPQYPVCIPPDLLYLEPMFPLSKYLLVFVW